ncbi:gamma carbonic anhydrase family protein [Vandammella animalimorsus]|uniref:Gamma carbonic anhydrase family protein n=1 Tax=Vandammella animalimorsus TaxID=2029117 RepID=A0A2A2ALU6_9BURK|nr:gamma carbonic anhydrase family protein [Vandammella animalimorsus]PAT38698.1 gamma carbonic anhydrase family protein [Vandammella animalimorsus]
MALYELDGIRPTLEPGSWVADSATVLGNVTLEAHSSVWFGAVIRGDGDHIRVGAGSNVQDGSVLHVDPDKPLDIGRDVTIGHQVMLHGCTIGDESLIGIGAVVLNGARIGKNCLVGARALVTENKEFPDGCMILGSPAKVVRMLTPQEIEALRQSARHYRDNAQRFAQGLKRVD